MNLCVYVRLFAHVQMKRRVQWMCARVLFICATAAAAAITAATAHAPHYVMAQNASELARNKTKVSTISNEY